MKEFREEQDALKKIVQTTEQMKTSKKAREREVGRLDEFDDVPTRDRVRTPKPQGIPQAAKLPKPTYNPDRVKSSLPMNARADYRPAKKVAASSPKNPMRQVKEQKAATYIEDLKRKEVQRAVQLRQEEAATQVVLEKMRDNPNTKLFEVHNEV